MLAIKLVRYGKKNLPSFRVAVTNGKKIVEFLGSYYPHPQSPHFVVSKERLEHWLKSGAKISPAVENLIKGKYDFKNYVPKKAESRELASVPVEVPASEPVKSPTKENA